VIIPCFDDGATVEEAVGSVRTQEVPAEIIVVDDGSDGAATVAALERLEQSGVRVLHQANQGPAIARTAGVLATDAEYVFPLDADDLLAQRALGRLREVLDERPDVAAAWGSVLSFGELTYVHRSRPSLDPWQVSYQNHLPIGSLYRRSALIDAGGWQLAGGYEDWDLWMTLAERGWKGIGIPEVTAHYRIRPGRRLSRSSRRHAERYARLRARHPTLFAERGRQWRSSPAPLLLKLTLPAIDALPLNQTRKRPLGGAMTHIAYRNGWGTMVARYRAHRVLRDATAHAGHPTGLAERKAPAA
jgi:glycosyltransferase involved in cell wall biosynthesis